MGKDTLVKKVASVNNNTIVVVNSVGPVVVESWVNHPNGMYVSYYLVGRSSFPTLLVTALVREISWY